MQREKFINFNKERHYDTAVINQGLKALEELETHCIAHSDTLDVINLHTLKAFINTLIDSNRNTQDHLMALARYYHVIDNKEIYIYFTALFNSVGVIPSICDRLHETGEFRDCEEAPLGLDPEAMPEYTKKFMEHLESRFEEKEYTKILAGNNHQIPREAMLAEKAHYEAAASLDIYLKERHQRKIDELTDHLKEDKVWFEQIITQPVIDYVAGNQEILSAVREGDSLYVTKIPFDTKAFLEAKDTDTKRYYACHCPFVREGIKNNTLDVNHNWCYCSAGFAKYPYEVMFDETLDVELLETPLKGDLRCRFKIKLPKGVVG